MSRKKLNTYSRPVQIYINIETLAEIDKEGDRTNSGRGIVIEKAWKKLNAMIEKYES